MAGKLEPLDRLTLGPFFFDYKVGAVLQIFFAAITSPTTYTYIRTTALV
jgi:hypothetical protein